MYRHVSDCISRCRAVAALLQRCCSAVAALLHQWCTAVATLLHSCEWHTKMLQPHLSSMRKITFQLIFPKKIWCGWYREETDFPATGPIAPSPFNGLRGRSPSPSQIAVRRAAVG